MKNLFVAIACVVGLAGCGKDVSGKFTGTWERPGYSLEIKAAGDHYTVNSVRAATGKSSFEAKEDADGFLVFSDSGQKFLKWKDENTVTNSAGEKPMQRVSK
ncbi:hypothetical protein BTN33_22580 [Aeromonas veronii]|uniref:hypothetical protein n=1 Tax=Aeromonas veronii TaxID=654 RepID=UPI000946F9A4|nr:hypothetical protein [Aeromonas veronii]OLF56782.1 hypothetical protein BTN33_22580 [Aeromonas veronii]